MSVCLSVRPQGAAVVGAAPGHHSDPDRWCLSVYLCLHREQLLLVLLQVTIQTLTGGVCLSICVHREQLLLVLLLVSGGVCLSVCLCPQGAAAVGAAPGHHSDPDRRCLSVCLFVHREQLLLVLLQVTIQTLTGEPTQKAREQTLGAVLARPLFQVSWGPTVYVSVTLSSYIPFHRRWVFDICSLCVKPPLNFYTAFV